MIDTLLRAQQEVSKTTHDDGERDDLTFSEKIINIFLFAVLLIAMLCFIIQLRFTFKSSNNKEYSNFRSSGCKVIYPF